MILVMSSIFFMSMLLSSSSPFKLSMFLTLISTCLSMLYYDSSNSIFIPCAMIISFSSGMMILFSYCSMTSNHEVKNNLPNTNMNLLILSTLSLLAILINPPSSTMPQETMENLSMVTHFSYMLVFIMFIVIIVVFCMNLTFFNPTKKFMESY